MRKIKFMKFIHIVTLILVAAIAIVTALFVIDDQAFVSTVSSIFTSMGKEVDSAELIGKLSLILPICLLSGVILLIIEEFFYSKIVKKVKRDAVKRRFKLSRRNKKLFSKEAPASQVAESITINIENAKEDIKEKRKETKRELKALKKKAKLEAKKQKLAELQSKVEDVVDEVEDVVESGQDITINVTKKTEDKTNSTSQNDLDSFLRNIKK